MTLEADLTRYNPRFRKSFRLKRFWTILLYDLVFVIFVSIMFKIFLSLVKRQVQRLPDPATLFTIGAVQAEQQIGVFQQFFTSLVITAIVMGVIVLLVWLGIKMHMWSVVMRRRFQLQDFLVLIGVYIVWGIITLPITYVIVRYVGEGFVSVATSFEAAGYPLILSAFFLAALLVLVVFPALLYILNYTHLFIIERLRKQKGFVKRVFQNHGRRFYVPHLYMGLAFVATAIISLVLKLLPETGEAFLSGVLLILFFAWEKSYLLSIVQ